MYAVYYWTFSETGSPVKRLIYAPNSGEDNFFITSGKLQKGINMAGSFTLTIPPTNKAMDIHWSEIVDPEPVPIDYGQGTLISVELVQNGVGKEIWRGRIIDQKWDIYRNMTLECEGILAFFNDILLPEYNFAWSGIISQEYNPDEGLKYVNLDALKDFLPNLSTDGIGEAVKNVVDNVVSNDSFSPDKNEIYDTMAKGLPVSQTSPDGSEVEDNVDRRVSVYDYLLFVVTIYNTELTQSFRDRLKQIKIGYIDPVFKTDKYLINHKTTEYKNAWSEISSNILDIYGGIMFLSNWYTNANGEKVFDETSSYLYYYKENIGTLSQVIQYGENLVDFEIEYDHTKRISRWYVFGKVKDANGKETLVDMSSVNNGLKYVGTAMDIGTISSVEYTDLTTPQDCYNRAVELFQKSFLPSDITTLTAVDMNLLDSSIESFEPGYKVRAYVDNKSYTLGSGWHKEYDFIIESISLDLLSPEDSECILKRKRNVNNSDQS